VLRETTDVFRPPFPYNETIELFLSSAPGTGEGPTLRSVLEAWLGRREASPFSSSTLGMGERPRAVESLLLSELVVLLPSSGGCGAREAGFGK